MTRLRDGTPVWIRPLRPGDRSVIVDVFERLSPRSRQRRFLTPITELSDPLLTTLVEEVDGVSHLALLMFAGTECIGVGRLIRLADEPAAAEMAISVVDEWQGRGAGTLLARELLARAPDVRRLQTQLADDNQPSRQVLSRLGGLHEDVAQGVRKVTVDLLAA